MNESTRRDFLRLGGAAVAGAALGGVAGAAPATQPSKEHATVMTKIIPGAIDQNGDWTLPPLPYDYSALEPHIDEMTMRIHHDKHHAGYVNGLKKAESELAKARESGDFSLVQHWTGKASFTGGGHFLHSVFWASMGPNGGGDPKGALAARLRKDFGTLESFKKQFGAAAKSVEGSGWGLLVFQLASGRLAILQGQNQNLLSQWGVIPILGVDVWEHAYYLKYQNDRGSYVDAWWNTVNWDNVGERFEMLASGAM